MRSIPFAIVPGLVAFAAIACNGGNTTTDSSPNDAATQDVANADAVTNDTASNDVPAMDAPNADVVTMDAAADVAADATPDASPSDGGGVTCGTTRPTVSTIVGTEGLVIGPDGTIYYSQSAAVGRMRPGMAQENAWVALPGATTVWGIALDVPNHTLYVGSPSTHRVYTIDVNAATPTATMLAFTAGSPNGLTVGPDGAVYYSDFAGGQVYRIDPATGMRTTVTTSTITQANGVAFASDGSLYVDNYSAGTLVRLTLAAGQETARSTVAMNLGSPDGLAFDAMGRIYVTDNAGGRLIRLDADGTNPMVLHTGITAAANIEFGAGALSCTDIYVATRGALYRYEMGTTPGADVPWHHAP